eukprot:Hpha_TRINITY_DN26380_c0_g1::TRINITY_DN26380_c0_g1_i1::g.9418::m.9418/K12817/PRPF18, PRP18; pre-mRNA-splicing factor 18
MPGWGALKAKLGGKPNLLQKRTAADMLAESAEVSKTPPAEAADELRFFRRGDREREREAEVLKQREAAELQAKRRRMELASGGVSQQLLAGSKMVYIPNQEVVRRLRERGEPATLFGETEVDRLRRFHELSCSELNTDDMADLGKNQFRERQAKAESDALERDKARIEQGKSAEEVEEEEEKKLVEVVKKKVEELGELDSKIAALCPPAGREEHQLRDSPEADMRQFVGLFIERVLLQWHILLLQRPWEVKKSFPGKRESTRHEETRAFMKPLVDALRKKGGTSGSIIEHFYAISYYTLQKEYVRANDFYLKVAIGNSSWPLGVTQTGIHSRVGGERIMSSKQAHILNNETQRKFIQGMKRLISQMQNMQPAAKSKMVIDYVAS